MKYCPYCGADLIDDTCSFCAECGKTLPIAEKANHSANGGKHHHKKGTRKTTGTHTKKHTSHIERRPAEEYDGYYDDIAPDDDGAARQALDKALIKKIVFLIIGLLIIVGACVAIMYLL